MNKKAQIGSQLMIFPFILLLVIIGVGIVAGAVSFFGKEYDYRNVDADILNNKIQNCLSEQNIIWNDDSFYKLCDLDKNSILNNSIIFKICKNSDNCIIESDSSKIQLSVGGNFNACSFIGTQKNDAFPKCTEKVTIINGVKYDIITGSNQFSKKRVTS